MKSYDDLLKSKRWQSKRKQIFARDNWKCTVCGNTANLRCHHTYYYRDHPAPWEYPDDCFLTLCEDCHNEWHRWHENIIKDSPPRPKKTRKVRKQRKPRGIRKKEEPLKETKKRIVYDEPPIDASNVVLKGNECLVLIDGKWIKKRIGKKNKPPIKNKRKKTSKQVVYSGKKLHSLKSLYLCKKK